MTPRSQFGLMLLAALVAGVIGNFIRVFVWPYILKLKPFFVIAMYLLLALSFFGCKKQEQLAANAPPGYWTIGGVGCLSCNTIKPYTIDVCPADNKPYYLRYDASMMEAPAWSGADDAISSGQGGGAHTTQYFVQTFAGSGKGWLVPIRSGQAAPGQGEAAPVPYRDLPVRNRPGLTLCEVYRQQNGLPDSFACPSNASPAIYAQQVTAMGEWKLAWDPPGSTTGVKEKHDAQCTGPQPTVTRTTTRTPTGAPPVTAPPSCPTCRPEVVCVTVTPRP